MPVVTGVTTLTRPVSGEKFFWESGDLPEIGRLRIFSGKCDIILGYCTEKQSEV